MIISTISREMRLTRYYLDRVIETASHRYKEYTIPKRTGGFRIIHHPSRELKLIQSWLADNVFSYMMISEFVYSYKANVGILDHALIHKNNNYLLRVDFKDFFPSITRHDVETLIKKNLSEIPLKLTLNDCYVISKLVCRLDSESKLYGLTIGAPSSPVISNSILYEFDTYWGNKCDGLSIKYSRYADDLFFSTNKPNVLANIFEELQAHVNNMRSPKIIINRDKTIFTSRKRRRVITGLIITSENHISIGRAKKREIKSMIFKYTKNQLDQHEISYLRGYLSYAKSVEPSFIKSMNEKFGKVCINGIRKQEPISNKKNSQSTIGTSKSFKIKT